MKDIKDVDVLVADDSAKLNANIDLLQTFVVVCWSETFVGSWRQSLEIIWPNSIKSYACNKHMFDFCC